MKRFLAAIRFLTLFPLPDNWGTDQRLLTGSTPFFPLVGLLIGAIAAAGAFVLSMLLPPFLCAVFITFLLLVVSGGLHMDGVADCADGFFSSRPRQHVLEIMRDSRIGAMGVMAIVFIVLLKTAALASMAGQRLWQGVFLAPVAGRVAILISMAMLPYARPEGGLGSLFYTGFSRVTALWGLIFLGICGWLVGGGAGILVWLTVIVAIGLFNWWCFRKIGGATGDTLGAACELAETVAIVAAVVFQG